MLLALFSILFGLPLAFGASRVVAGTLYNVCPNDPVSFGLISAVLAAIAALASYVPAQRALEVDSLEALRGEVGVGGDRLLATPQTPPKSRHRPGTARPGLQMSRAKPLN
jgi:hypothetical protein